MEVANTFKNMKFADEKYAGFYEIFASMFSEKILANQKLVGNVLRVFDNLVENLNKDQTNLNVRERNAVIRYNIVRGQHLVLRNKYQAQYNSLLAAIANLNGVIAGLESSITNDSKSLKHKVQVLAEKREELKKANAEYKARVARRNHELSVIAQVVEIFKTKFSAQVRAYVKNVKI